MTSSEQPARIVVAAYQGEQLVLRRVCDSTAMADAVADLWRARPGLRVVIEPTPVSAAA